MDIADIEINNSINIKLANGTAETTEGSRGKSPAISYQILLLINGHEVMMGWIIKAEKPVFAGSRFYVEYSSGNYKAYIPDDTDLTTAVIEALEARFRY